MPNMTRKTIHQLMITLKGISPPIWRRLQVRSDISLYDLHLVLQGVMGWDGSHLYQFKIGGVPFGEPEPEEVLFFRTRFEEAGSYRLSQVARRARSRFLYEYDFGDCWQHDILVERVLPADPQVSYPVCSEGARAGPPEDCGGAWGYMDLLEIVSNPDHEEYGEKMRWLGGKFDPEAFDLEAVNRTLRRRFATGRHPLQIQDCKFKITDSPQPQRGGES